MTPCLCSLPRRSKSSEASIGAPSELWEETQDGEIFGMDPLAPEIRRLEIFFRAVAKQALDILTDKGRREIAVRLEAVDHGGGAFEQTVDRSRTFASASSAALRVPISLHEPPTSSSSPSASRTRVCRRLPSNT